MIKKYPSKEPLIFILYDSINNSIFDGQILEPLINHKKKNPQQPIIIISFEKKIPSAAYLKKRIPQNIASIVCLKKLPFLGKWSSIPAIIALKQYLKKFSSYSIIARGPLAGFVSLKALNTEHCTQFTVQIRGLLAAEYTYEHAQEKNIFKQWWHQWRTSIFAQLEKKVYTQSTKNNFVVHFEAVSNALKEHLITNYQTPAHCITIAYNDIPSPIPTAKIQEWRTATRTELTISPFAQVYCYNGSLKPWQCPEKTIVFFKKELEKDSNSYLLILTQDVAGFKHLLEQKNIPEESYTIMTVPHSAIYNYLATCDAGIIFREKHLINWTSRPTKILEYQAVGLPILHNNTIAMLTEDKNNDIKEIL